MPKTYYLSDNFVNLALRGTSFSPPSAIYVALYTTSPTLAGGGVEVSGGSYTRQSATWVVSSNGQTSNDSDITFPIATALWGTVTSFGLLDSLSGGNLLYFTPLNAPRVVQINDQVMFPTGQLVVIED